MGNEEEKIEISGLEKKDGREKNGGSRVNAGRPPFKPTENEKRQVEAMSGYGVPIDQIATMIQGGISADTLTKYFEKELITGKAKANAGVGRILHQKAMNGDTTAAIWWSKTQMRWREVYSHEVTGKDGGALNIMITPNQASIL